MEHVERASADAQPPLLRLRSGTGAALIAAALAVQVMTNTALTGATFDVDGGQQLT
jgi:hypothetical protein